MKIQNAIKKATKTLGIEPKICGNKYYFTKGNQELSFFENQGNARGLNIRWLNDKDDFQADYCAGTFFKNLDQALKCFNFNASNTNYILNQLEKVDISREYKSTIKIKGGESGETANLSITNKQLEAIKQILLNSKN